jgi:hypothetical protein
LRNRRSANYKKPRSYASKLVKEIGQPIKEKSHLFDADYVKSFILELIIIGDGSDVKSLVKSVEIQDKISSDSIIKFFQF